MASNTTPPVIFIDEKSTDAIKGGSTDDKLTGGWYLEDFIATNNDSISGEDGNDTIYGQNGNDSLSGGLGDDSLYGGYENYSNPDHTIPSTGDDTLNGGAGNDHLYGQDGNDVLDGEKDNDILYGGDIDNTGAAVPGSGNDTLNGGSGNDELHGQDGVNSLVGGSGDDIYWIDNTFDKITEKKEEGTDIVKSSVSFSLLHMDYVETLELTGKSDINGTGSAQANSLYGNEGNNSLDGGDGNDTLDGNIGNDTLDGGIGNDTLTGGSGNDVYVVDNLGDIVEEVGKGKSGGIDTVQSYISLPSLAPNVENLVLLGSSNINGYGNALSNVLTGNIKNNILSGDAENDTLIGNGGDDALSGGDGMDTAKLAKDGQTVSLDNIESVEGDAGDDTIKYTEYASNSPPATIKGGGGADRLTLAPDGQAVIVHDVTTVTGGSGKDIITYQTNTPAIVDGGGDSDRLNLAANGQAVQISSVEIVNGSAGDDSIDILAGGSVVYAWAENDTITVSKEADKSTVYGGAGNDIYEINIDGVTVSEEVQALDGASPPKPGVDASGHDEVRASVTFSLPNYIENLTLTGIADIKGTGNKLPNYIKGNTGNNVLNGNSRNDTLIGDAGSDTLNGGDGSDSMQGGSGDDVYLVDSTDDRVSEKDVGEGGGTDKVKSSINFTLPDYVENLLLTGTSYINGTGNALSNELSGNSGDNFLIGYAGNDTLIGNGGNDILQGGADTDTAILADQGQSVSLANIESVQGGAGSDFIQYTTSTQATIKGDNGADSLELAPGGQIVDVHGVEIITGDSGKDVITYKTNTPATIDGGDEKDSLNLAAGGQAIKIYNVESVNGNTGDDNIDILTGSSVVYAWAGKDTIIVEEGTDKTKIYGGKGSDTYQIHNASAQIEEINEESTIDTVQSWVDFTLSNYLENLELFGTANISGTGNEQANQLTGNDGNNTLNGGLGIDFMQGGNGNDTYLVDNIDDIVSEENVGIAGGIDTIQSLVAFSLPAYVENLEFTGSAHIGGDGNELANKLTGNSGNNKLYGADGNDTLNGGASGDDTLYGGSGTDTAFLNDGEQLVSLGNVEIVIGSAQNNTMLYQNYTTDTTATIDGGGGNGDKLKLADTGQKVQISNVETVNGGNGDDTITYITTTPATVNGFGGSKDTLSLAKGGQRVTLTNVEIVIGNTGNDSITYTDKTKATVNGGGGSDSLQMSAGQALLIRDVDTITGSGGTETITIDAPDRTTHIAAVESVYGSAGSDTIVYDSATPATVAGNGGSDSLTLYTGQTVTIQSIGQVIGRNNGVESVIIGTAKNTTQFSRIESITGSSGDDTIILTDNTQATISGKGGSDSLVLFTGQSVTILDVETITGSTGVESVTVAQAGKTSQFSQVETISGSSGDDIIVLADNTQAAVSGNGGADLLKLFAGESVVIRDVDMITGSTGVESVTVAQAETTSQFSQVEKITGSKGNDTIVFTDNTQATVSGNSGTDSLELFAGQSVTILDVDIITGSTGAESVTVAQAGTTSQFTQVEVITGSSGNDTIVLADNTTATINGGNGTDSLQLGNEGQTVSVAAVEAITGGDGRDTIQITGNTPTAIVNGGTGDDSLFGNNGVETLNGGDGNDTLDGKGGNDSLTGGEAQDTITGGSGADAIVLSETTPVRDTVVCNISGDSTLASMDTITGFLWGNTASADIVDFGNVNVMPSNSVLVVNGIVRSAVYAKQTTLDGVTNAIIKALNNDTKNADDNGVMAFQYDGNTYMARVSGVDGKETLDNLIELTGINVTLTGVSEILPNDFALIG